MRPGQVFLWSLPGFLVYAVLQVIAFRKLTGPREDKAKTGWASLRYFSGISLTRCLDSAVRRKWKA
jgi:hypothetical protein